ncbi:MAG: Omp28-related outer membrane protein [Crocinitomicaceae bacterium]|nr:Omp28-related outer membrane protein [Crocinitomicaceae bacterium]
MKYLLFTCLLTFSFIVNAQFSENFEGVITPALPVGWTQITNATDGGYNTSIDYTSSYFSIPLHTTYIGTSDDLCNCDKSNEQLISPAFTLPSSGVYRVEFEYVLGAYYGENATIGVSTDGGVTSNNLSSIPSTELGSPAEYEWKHWEQELSAYAGQTINLVWRYNDNGNWSAGFMLDDIVVKEIPSVDMKMLLVANDTTIVAGNYTISGTVKNLGADPISSFDIVWNDGSGNNSENFNVNLAFGDEYNFIHATPLLTTPGNHNIEIFVVAAGDTINSNDTLVHNVAVVSQLVPKVVVGEVKTGEWCGWGPGAHVAMAEMSLSNTNDFISIAIHNGDPMALATYDQASQVFPDFGSYPYGTVDRVIGGSGSSLSQMHAQRISHVPPAAIHVASSVNGSILTVDVLADMVTNLTGDYRLAVVLVEDSILGGGQSNYYPGNGALQFPNAGSMANFDVTLAGGTISPYYHDHVARALGGNQINGVPVSLPASLLDGTTYNFSYDFFIDSIWNLNKMSAVGMLIDASTGEILNAGKHRIIGIADLPEGEDKFEISVIPNPTASTAHILVDTFTPSELSFQVTNVLGEVVYNSGSISMAAGAYTIPVNLSNQPSGMYIVRAVIGDQLEQVKINLIK